jgi:antirestriction protein
MVNAIVDRACEFIHNNPVVIKEKNTEDIWNYAEEDGSPVWATVGDKFMYRDVDGMMSICVGESKCYDDTAECNVCNPEVTARVVSPTELSSDEWLSDSDATLKTEYAAATERLPPYCPMETGLLHGLGSPTCASPRCTGWTKTTRRWLRPSGNSPRSPESSSVCVELEKRTAIEDIATT